MKALPSWPDEAIWNCDLRRLWIAIDAANEQLAFMMRHDYRVAGADVEEPTPDPKTDEEFNNRFRDALAYLKTRRKPAQ